MNCWQILEIDETSQKKAIRKAYAKKLRDIDAETEADLFQQLKEAYDCAVQWANEHDDTSSKVQHMVPEEAVDLFGDPPQEADQQEGTAFFSVVEFTEEPDFLQHIPSVSLEEDWEEQQDQKEEQTTKRAFIEVGDLITLEELIEVEKTKVIPDFWLLEKVQFDFQQLDENGQAFYRLFEEIYAEGDYFKEDSEWRVLFAGASKWSAETSNQIAAFIGRFLTHFCGAISYEVLYYLEKVIQKILPTTIKVDLAEYQKIKDIKLMSPKLSLDICEHIPPLLRGSFLVARWNLFVLLCEPEMDEIKWQDYMATCVGITEQDPTIDFFKAEKILWEDFRLENEDNILKLNELLKYVSSKNQTRLFIEGYIQRIHENKENNVLEIKKRKLIMPTNLYKLLVGNLYYQKHEWKKVKKYWHELITENGQNLFTDGEIKRVKQTKGTFFSLFSKGLVLWILLRIAITFFRYLFQ